MSIQHPAAIKRSATPRAVSSRITSVPVDDRPVFGAFDVEVASIERVGESFLRVTFAGDDLTYFVAQGFDQRVKLVLPLADGSLDHFPRGRDWFASWRLLPDDQRNVLRTYTVRDFDAAERELVIDFATHTTTPQGVAGPATRWVIDAVPGDRVLLVGPDVRSAELAHTVPGGVEFQPGSARRILLAGDESAAPAICAILEQLPSTAKGQAFIEVPSAADILPVRAPGGLVVTWLARDERRSTTPGEVLARAVRAWVGEMTTNVTTSHEVEPEADGMLWEVPAASEHDALYAWLAGEASCIRDLRRHLVRDRGLDKRDVAFMGYWRRGSAEGA